MQMPGRTWIGAGGKYRYGMNGQEKEDELFEGANSAEYWMYDSRIGRRWEKDPITYPWQSPYACFNNNPIYYSDPKGLEGEEPVKKGQPVDLGNGQMYTPSTDEVEVTATKEGTSNKAIPVSMPTYLTSLKRYDNRDLGVDVLSGSVDAGMYVNVEMSHKTYRSGYNPNVLWSDQHIVTSEVDLGWGFGWSLGVDYGIGTFKKVGIWENPFKRILGADDIDLGVQSPWFLRAGTNSGDGTYDFVLIGVGFGGGEHWGEKDGFTKFMSKNPFGGGYGITDPNVLYMSIPTLADSIRTALNNPNDTLSIKILNRHPEYKPKCITCD